MSREKRYGHMARSGSQRYRLTLPFEKYEYKDNKPVCLGEYENYPGSSMAIEVKGRESAILTLIKALRKAGMTAMRVQRGYYLWKDK